MMIAKSMAIATILAGAALGLAGPASAQLDAGTYTRTMTEGQFQGVHDEITVTSCGQNCVTFSKDDGPLLDLHRQGSTWTGSRTDDNGVECSWTVDDASLVLRIQCPETSYVYQLTKNG